MLSKTGNRVLVLLLVVAIAISGVSAYLLNNHTSVASSSPLYRYKVKFECGYEKVAFPRPSKSVLIIDDVRKLAFFGWYRATQMPDTGWDLLKRTIDWATEERSPATTKIAFFTYDGTLDVITPVDYNEDARAVYNWLIGFGYTIVLHHQNKANLPPDYYPNNNFHLVIHWFWHGYDSTNIVNSGVPFITVCTGQTDEMGIGTGIEVQDYGDTFCVVDNT